MPKQLKSFVCLVVCAITLTACVGSREAPSPDEGVRLPAHHIAEHTIHTADMVSAVLVRFFIAGRRAGTVTQETLDTYLQDVNPSLQLAIDQTRERLRKAIEQPTEDTMAALTEQTAVLTDALENAAFLAQKHGW
jgi:flagellar motor protein MotB